MRRRDFLALAAAAAAFPRLAVAQQPQLKRLGFLTSLPADDPGTSNYLAALRAGLASQGWEEGRNLIIDYRFNTSVLAADAQRSAQELIDLKPDVLVSGSGGGNAIALAGLTKTIPIIFAVVPDSTGTSIIGNLAHPVGNVTGFLNFDDATISGKWLELLQELSPDLQRAGLLFNANNAGLRSAFDVAAKKLGIEPVYLDTPSLPDVIAALADFSKQPKSGVVLTNDTVYLLPIRRQLYVAVAADHLPAVWGHILYAFDGAQVVYTIDQTKQEQGGGEYAGRVLNGEKIADLPAQLPSKYSLFINLRTAKAKGLAIPQSLIIRADQVIE